MEVEKLLKRLIQISRLSDFLIIKAGYDERLWGRYYKQNKDIVIYNLDEDGLEYPDWVLVKTACHELAHHFQYHYASDQDMKEPHGDYFQKKQDRKSTRLNSSHANIS